MWWLITILALVAMVAPSLLLLLMFGIITIPLAILGWMAPTIWLYVTPALGAYALSRRRLRRRGYALLLAFGVLVISLGIGSAVSLLANREIAKQVSRLRGDDILTAPTIRPVKTAALLGREDSPSDWDRKCHEFCQRLLFTGLAQQVIVGPAADTPGETSHPLILHEIVPVASGCDNTLLAAVRAERRDVPDLGPRQNLYLWVKLDDLWEKGRCFRSRPIGSADADIWFIETFPRFSPVRTTYDMRLMPVDLLGRREIIVRRGEDRVRIMRESRVSYHLLAVPLQIATWTDFTTGRPGHWGYGGGASLDVSEGYRLDEWLGNDLAVEGLESESITVTATGPSQR
jgi:hypothetical protein